MCREGWFMWCIIQLTSLTGRLLGLPGACRRWIGVAWKRYKTRVNRALRLLDASLTLLGAFWTPLGSFWTPWTPFGMPFGCHFELMFHNFYAVFTYISSAPKIIYDIGTRFLIFHCFATKMLLLFCKSMIPVRFCTVFPLHSCAGIKTRFKVLLKTQYLTLGPNF